MLAVFFVFRRDRGKRFKERLCVRVLRRIEHSGGGAPFDDLTGVKDQNPVSKTRKQSRIVGDKNHGEAKLFPERAEHAEDFHLGYWIERGRRFIRDQEYGIAGDSLGYEGALLLAAAELVRIGEHDAIGVLRKKLSEHLASAIVQNIFR